MTIQAQHKELIELAIKRNPHYKGNEALFDIFCADVYTRVRDILDVLGDKMPPQSYIDKIVHKSILNTLKEQKRLDSGIHDSESPIENPLSFNINEYGHIVFDIPYPNSEREKNSIIYEQLKIIINKLYRINEHESEKQFTKLFELRYAKNLTISDLAYKLDATEAQVSQKLFELLAKLNDY